MPGPRMPVDLPTGTPDARSKMRVTSGGIHLEDVLNDPVIEIPAAKVQSPAAAFTSRTSNSTLHAKVDRHGYRTPRSQMRVLNENTVLVRIFVVKPIRDVCCNFPVMMRSPSSPQNCPASFVSCRWDS